MSQPGGGRIHKGCTRWIIDIIKYCTRREDRMRAILAMMIALASTAAMAAGSSQGYGGGAINAGAFARFEAVVQQYNQSGELFRIVGRCQSACTIFLSIRNVCIEPSARLLFHAGGNPSSTGRMLGAYNSALSAYLSEHHAMEPNGPFFTISGADMISKFGYRRCP
jgi:hypothetical protein